VEQHIMNVFDVAALFVELVRRDYPDDVALIVYYGSYAIGSASERSDLDFYFIPDDGKAQNLYHSVLYQGLAFEFWGVPWDFAQRIASGEHRWSVAPSIIANGRVLYARSDADRKRFEALQKQIRDLQTPERKPQMVRLALGVFERAPFYLYRLNEAAANADLPGARWAAVQTLDVLLDCLAMVNQTFFAKNWASDLRQLDALTVQPEGLCQRIHALLTSSDLVFVARTAAELVSETRRILLEAQRAINTPMPAAQVFAGFYPGIKEYLNKVLSACERHDSVAASVAAVQIQKDVALMLAQTEMGIPYSEFNPFGEYRNTFDRLGLPDLTAIDDSGDFEALAAQVELFDARVRQVLTERGVALNDTESWDDLKRLIGMR
jgi:hypothetical protein